MRVLLVSPNKEKLNMHTFPLGMSHVAAAAAKAGHEVRTVDYMLEEAPEAALADAIAGFSPGVIGVSLRNIDDQSYVEKNFLVGDAKKAVEICRGASDATIVMGGAGYSIFPGQALDYCGADMGIQGEGERAFVMLLAELEGGGSVDNVPGLHLPGRGMVREREYEKCLDSIPAPDYSSWKSLAAKETAWLPVQSRRGCPFDCSYCSTSTIEGRIIRKKSPAAVVDSIRNGYRAGFRNFYFTDNTFNFPPTYAKELCRAIIDSGMDIRWRCILYPYRLDEELVDLMAHAGCAELSVGAESGSARILERMNKRFTPDDIRRSNRLVAQRGITQMGFMMPGGPGETKETVTESMNFMGSLEFAMGKITPGIRIYRGTRLALEAIRDGIIASEDELFEPRFYMVPGLEDWLFRAIRDWTTKHENWFY